MSSRAALEADLPSVPLLVGLVAVASAAALMLEIVAGRLVAPYVGTSLYTWTAIIAVVLAGLSLGALMGGRLADGPLGRGRDRLVAALALAALFTLLTPVLLARTAALALGGHLTATLEALVLAMAMLFVPSVFAGLVSPLAGRLALAQTPAEGTGRVLGRIFAAGSAGSIVGTLLAGFVLIGRLGSLNSVILIAALYATAALAVLVPARRTWRVAALLVAGAGIVVAAGRNVEAWRSPCDAESAYSCVRVEEVGSALGGPARLLVIDDLSHGINLRDAPDRFAMGYLEFVDLVARERFEAVPTRSFFVGGGAYTLPRAWLAAGGEIVVAEIDPLVTATAQERLWLEPAPGLTVVHADARRALRDQPADARFEVIVGDAFRDVSVPPHLVTREFHELVRRRLTPAGLYVVNVIDRASAPRFTAAVAKTLRASFAHVSVWRERGDDDGTSGRVNHLVVASARPLDRAVIEGGPPFGRTWRTVTLDLDVPLLTDDYSPVARLMGTH
jgi:predicted membrane-bound spermidine synthase